MVEPRLPELPDQLIDLGLVATATRALDVAHPSPSPGSHQIGNHGDHRTLTTQRRWRIAAQDKAIPELLRLPLIETRAEHLLRAMEIGKVSTNVYLRRVHNYALDMSWLPAPIIPKRQWPAVRHRERRAITLDEHTRIVAAESNPERRSFYELAWNIGASQSDIAFLEAHDIDWQQRVISYQRKKTGEYALIRFDDEVERILRGLPASGPLFP